MSELIEKIRRAQVHAAEQAVIQDLQERGLAEPHPKGQNAMWRDADGRLQMSDALKEKLSDAMFDAFGHPRERYVRVSLDGAHCIMHPSEGDGYLEEARKNGDNSNYVVANVYLSEREFEDLGEFEGF